MRVSVAVDLDNALRKLLPRAARIEAALDAGAAAAHSALRPSLSPRRLKRLLLACGRIATGCGRSTIWST